MEFGCSESAIVWCQCINVSIYPQQEEVLSELHHYSHQIPPLEDSFRTQQTLAYLEACNMIFERGLLSHDKVASSECQVVSNFWNGYSFLTKWLNEIYEQGV